MHRPTKRVGREIRATFKHGLLLFSCSMLAVSATDYENKDSFPTDHRVFFFIPQIPYFWVSGTHSTLWLALNQHH